MKKYFLILLFSATTFCALGQVTIPDEVARFFLEQNLRAEALDSLVVIKDRRIASLTEQLRLKNLIEKSYIFDEKAYRDIIKLKDQQMKQKDAELVKAGKEINRQNRQKSMVLGAGAGTVAGSFVGQPVAGALIGTGAGFVISLFKKNKYGKTKDGG